MSKKETEKREKELVEEEKRYGGGIMKIDVRSNNSLYIKINGWTYYIDDSTDEQIVDKWITGGEE